MRDCDGCTACCEGHLSGEAYGHKFFPGQPCYYLGATGCHVHSDRPSACRDYFCAWAQELLPEDMKPTEVRALVSVERSEGKQFLRVVYLDQLNRPARRLLRYLDEWVKEHDSYYVTVKPTIIPIRPI